MRSTAICVHAGLLPSPGRQADVRLAGVFFSISTIFVSNNNRVRVQPHCVRTKMYICYYTKLYLYKRARRAVYICVYIYKKKPYSRRHVYNMYNDEQRRRPETFVARHGERRNKKLYYTRNSGCRENTKNPFTCGAPSGEESGRSRRYAYIMIRRVRVCLLPRPRPLTSTVLLLRRIMLYY